MANEYDITIPAHPNLYTGDERQLKIYFGAPEQINADTGMVLFIAGYGGHSGSKVYTKMRSVLADTFNLVTVQCDYFGHEFMQKPKQIDATPFCLNVQKKTGIPASAINSQLNGVEDMVRLAEKYDIPLLFKEALGESKGNFNDMSLMQSIDNITAVLAVIAILQDNDYPFNTRKMVTFGHSHGAYLAYLCNAFAPGLFKLMIDNSSYLYPIFMNPLERRIGELTLDGLILRVYFDYMATTMNEVDRNIMDLEWLYGQIENRCQCMVYHGSKDHMTDTGRKREFSRSIGARFEEVAEDRVDGQLFGSAEHGLHADFFKLFEHVMERFHFDRSTVWTPPDTLILESEMAAYTFDYSSGLVKVNKRLV
ncbi:DUF2920 family protein [Paenibacillus cymbidii]|uniref:DUF2920 family protein n=1 Tax=Paenibacillus cymbidii TaxID=1639034 RepID=UPI00107FDB91|nr:DUF2920 family protein [Paenibacillus cymbidii]